MVESFGFDTARLALCVCLAHDKTKSWTVHMQGTMCSPAHLKHWTVHTYYLQVEGVGWGGGGGGGGSGMTGGVPHLCVQACTDPMSHFRVAAGAHTCEQANGNQYDEDYEWQHYELPHVSFQPGPP